ncbi:phage holin family protein [Amycolatopsis acidicola]|uniref:Phage holin family protein n=1 Tax=Amycolatopsis acidicola TaxID=2596893 RepID=A0A5N0UNM5_9PSEU|nr:phage holin family protein [Amycolatopsis acidicola]KAA9149064.1 phage holin family protein [Amycolatopsis acidicola]
MTEQGSTAVEDRSIAQLVQDMSEQTRRLVRDEVQLAAAELKDKGKNAGVGAGLAGAAGVVALFGALAFVAAAILALALVVPGWAAALIVGGALMLVAGTAALIGRNKIRRAVPPVPEEAAAGVAEDVRAVREGSRHART